MRYRDTPERKGGTRRLADGAFAGSILAVMGVVAASFWGPIPMAWLRVGAQVQHRTGTVSPAILVAFVGFLIVGPGSSLAPAR